MRWLIAGFVLVLQAALPPAYPRPGATKLLENGRVIVWNISWLKQQYPLQRHIYDLVGVYYSPGDRIVVSQEGARRQVSTKAWETAFQLKGVTHIEEGASDAPPSRLIATFVMPSSSRSWERLPECRSQGAGPCTATKARPARIASTCSS